jgi:hypothetical protein
MRRWTLLLAATRGAYAARALRWGVRAGAAARRAAGWLAGAVAGRPCAKFAIGHSIAPLPRVSSFRIPAPESTAAGFRATFSRAAELELRRGRRTLVPPQALAARPLRLAWAVLPVHVCRPRGPPQVFTAAAALGLGCATFDNATFACACARTMWPATVF